MQERIEQLLSSLIGRPLQKALRTLDVQVFHFGALHTTETRFGAREVGEYALHIQCSWRIVKAGTLLVGSRDRYYPAGYPDQKLTEDFDWSEPDANRCDELIVDLLSQPGQAITVTSVIADALGGCSIQMTEDTVLEIFPDGSSGYEQWRLLQLTNARRHFVVTNSGIEVED